MIGRILSIMQGTQSLNLIASYGQVQHMLS
jgi:hypothetical protein